MTQSPPAPGDTTARTGSPAYLAGLLLRGRRVVVVGGGNVARRRVPKLLDAGARVDLIAPAVDPLLGSLADSGALVWHARAFTASDLDGSWYVLAATDSAEVNAGHRRDVRSDGRGDHQPRPAACPADPRPAGRGRHRRGALTARLSPRPHRPASG